MFVIASDGSDGVVGVGAVGGSEEDSVGGDVGLSHIKDLWSTRSCRMTDNSISTKRNTFLNEVVHCL